MISSLNSHRFLRATMTSCSFQAGWRSLLLRAYDDPPVAEPFTTPATPDHLVVLVTKGACEVEGLYRGRWQKASYQAGSIGMTAPGEQVMLRWNGTTCHSTVQMHIPAETIRSCAENLLGAGSHTPQMPHSLAYDDPLLREVMLGSVSAYEEGAPDLYAASAAQFIAMHLLVRHARYRPRSAPSRNSIRLRRVHDYMVGHLGEEISLDDLAKAACLSRYHFIRMFKQTCDQTPYQYLTRLRIEKACRELRSHDDPVSNIAAACGFVNQAHFAATFRRIVGASPTTYRRTK